jgi:hypothetical protein
MYNSHLVAILKTFSRKEIRDYKKWLQSPIHNQRDDVVKLFEYLMTAGRLEKEKLLAKERVFTKIFPGEAFDDAKIRQTMHFLLKATEEFLIYQELRGDEVRSQMALSSVYRKRKLDKAFQKTIRSVETLQEEFPYRDEHFFRNKYLLQIEKYTFFERKKRTIDYNLQEVSDALDITFLADKLRQTCLMLAHQAVYKTRYKIGLLEETIQYIEKNDLLHYPAIAIYYYGYMMSVDKDNSQEHFQALRLQINKASSEFTHSELRDIYLMAINYCVSQISVGNTQMTKELFDLYKDGMDSMTLIENNELSRYTFRNIVNLGIALEEFEWINNFIEKYQQYLPYRHREDFVLFARARLHYAKKEYKPAMQIIATLDFDDVLNYLYSKTLLTMMYYEEGELDALELLLDSMRKYLSRKEVMGNHKEIYSKVITYARKLIKVNPFDKSQVEKLRKEVTAANPLPNKSWFLKQIAQL